MAINTIHLMENFEKKQKKKLPCYEKRERKKKP